MFSRNFSLVSVIAVAVAVATTGANAGLTITEQINATTGTTPDPGSAAPFNTHLITVTSDAGAITGAEWHVTARDGFVLGQKFAGNTVFNNLNSAFGITDNDTQVPLKDDVLLAAQKTESDSAFDVAFAFLPGNYSQSVSLQVVLNANSTGGSGVGADLRWQVLVDGQESGFQTTTLPIPEPAGLVLLGLGGIMMLQRRRG